MDRHYKIVSGKNGGTASLLCPPGHPRHTYSLHEFNSPKGRSVVGSMAIDSALDPDSGASPAIRDRVQRIMDKAELKCSEAWVRNVYGYFRNSYAPEPGVREVAKAVGSGPAELHLGYLTVKEYFPDHEPRTDLIADPGKGYGTYPCLKCDARVQYEAKFDAFAKVGQGPTCYPDGNHQI